MQALQDNGIGTSVRGARRNVRIGTKSNRTNAKIEEVGNGANASKEQIRNSASAGKNAGVRSGREIAKKAKKPCSV